MKTSNVHVFVSSKRGHVIRIYIDIGRCGMSAIKTSLHPSNYLYK